MDRPQVERPRRTRVELRMQPQTAEALYARAKKWNLTISDAGNRLVEMSLLHLGDLPGGE